MDASARLPARPVAVLGARGGKRYRASMQPIRPLDVTPLTAPVDTARRRATARWLRDLRLRPDTVGTIAVVALWAIVVASALAIALVALVQEWGAAIALGVCSLLPLLALVATLRRRRRLLEARTRLRELALANDWQYAPDALLEEKRSSILHQDAGLEPIAHDVLRGADGWETGRARIRLGGADGIADVSYLEVPLARPGVRVLVLDDHPVPVLVELGSLDGAPFLAWLRAQLEAQGIRAHIEVSPDRLVVVSRTLWHVLDPELQALLHRIRTGVARVGLAPDGFRAAPIPLATAEAARAALTLRERMRPLTAAAVVLAFAILAVLIALVRRWWRGGDW